MFTKFRERPVVVGICVFVIVRICCSFFVGPTTCADGWHSSSIGRRGACSWHGGVGINGGAVLATLFSLGCGIGTWIYLLPAGPNRKIEEKAPEKPSEKQSPNEAHAPPPVERDLSVQVRIGPRCPKCGGHLLPRIARRGKHRGKRFLGCENYPHCDGIVELPGT
jgi:hypothetical protein